MYNSLSNAWGTAGTVRGGSLSDTAVLAILGGGSFNRLTDFPETIHANRLLAVDVVKELLYLHPARSAVTMPIVPGEMVATLMEKAVVLNPALAQTQARLRTFPATTLDEGLGMLRSVGVAAAQVALNDPSILHWLRTELMVPLHRQRNGRLRSVDLRYYNSLPGGTGGPVARAVTEVIAEHLRRSTSATVTVSGMQLGAVTFLGLGDEARLLQNGAVTLLEQVTYTLDPQRPAREARELVLAELPTIDAHGNELGTDRQTRSLLAVALARALASPGMQEYTLRGRPNNHLANRYGSITLTRSAWHGLVGPGPIVAAAARHYAAVVKQLPFEALPPGSALPTPHMELTPLPFHHQTKTADDLLTIIGQQRGRKSEAFEQQLCVAVPRTATVQIQLSAKKEPLERWLPAVANITSVAQLVLGYAYLRELTRALQSLLTETQKTRDQQQRRLKPLRAALLRAADRLLLPRADQKITDALIGLAGKKQRFYQAYNSFHQAQRNLLEAEAQHKALDAGLGRVRDTLEVLEALTRRFAQTLDNLADGQAEITCEFRPLAEIFPDLVRIINAHDRYQLQAFLASTAQTLTLAGLATLLQTEANVDAIVRRLLATPQYDGPPWGGDGGGRAPYLTLWVFPPVAAQLRQDIEQAVTHHDVPHTVVMVDSLASGSAVMLLECSDVGSLSDIFPPAYRLGLEEALTTEADLYPISDRARLLAMEILGPALSPANGNTQPSRVAA